jgi:hypothetical protein
MTIKTKKFRYFFIKIYQNNFLFNNKNNSNFEIKKMTKTGFLVKFNFNKILIFSFQIFIYIHEESNINLDYYLGAV